jgi:hypothetical protein
MIQFPCQCGHRFSFPEEMAGAFTQCPQCKRLIDIPTLSDLATLADDGTIRLQQVPQTPVDDPLRIAELKETFIRKARDEEGHDYDLRLTREEINQAGAEEIPLTLRDEAPPEQPKYDPETGELIEMIGFKPDPVPAVPVKAIPVQPISYASFETGEAAHSAAIALFMPANIAVMSILFVLQIACLWLWGWIPILALLATLPVFVMSVAHYANIVYDIGPEQKNELPRPLRDLELWDDVFSPFFQSWMSLVISFGPAIAVLVRTMDPRVPLHAMRLPLTLMVAGAGLFVFPAVFLTLTTSGTLFNLRPDRIWGVIRQSGIDYLVVLGLAVLAAAAHVITIFYPMRLPHYLLIFPMIFACTYLAHLFCWKLGELHRKHHERFPWVLQRHTPKPLEERLASQRLASRRRGAAQRAAMRTRPAKAGAGPAVVKPIDPPASKRSAPAAPRPQP